MQSSLYFSIRNIYTIDAAAAAAAGASLAANNILL